MKYSLFLVFGIAALVLLSGCSSSYAEDDMSCEFMIEYNESADRCLAHTHQEGTMAGGNAVTGNTHYYMCGEIMSVCGVNNIACTCSEEDNTPWFARMDKEP